METETPQGAQPQLPELTPRQAAFLSDARDGLSHREIAVKHGCSVPTVTTVLYRLRNRSLERIDERALTLTLRQLEITALLGVGSTFQEIGDMLCMSPRTVETHAKLARERMGARNVAHLVTLAIADELLILDHDGQLRVPYSYRVASVPTAVA